MQAGWLGLATCGFAWVGLLVELRLVGLLVDLSWLWLLCANGLAWAGRVWVGLVGALVELSWLWLVCASGLAGLVWAGLRDWADLNCVRVCAG